MNARKPERREGAMELTANDIRVRAGFKVTTEDPVAGGPIELEFFIENLGSGSLQLAVSGDRMRQRPAQFKFKAVFEGSPLEDPRAGVPNMGGPLGVIEVIEEKPWRQTLKLNDFIRLEETPRLLGANELGRLELTCHRALALAATEAEALSPGESTEVVVELAFDLRRDNAARPSDKGLNE